MAREPRPRKPRSAAQLASYGDELFKLDSPTGESDSSAPASVPAPPAPGDPTVSQWVPIERLHINPFQTRTRINSLRLRKLVKSLDEFGQLQAAPARPFPGREGHFQLMSGHRRRAAVEAGANAGIKEEIPQHFIGQMRIESRPRSNREMLDGAYAENEDREDHSIFDDANYYTMLRAEESKERANEPRFSSVSNAPNNRGAAVTADGLISWESLCEVREKEGKPLPPAKTLRRIVSVLALPVEVQDRLAEINFASEGEAENGKFKSVTEAHCRALLMLRSDAGRQAELLAEIEQDHIGGNQAIRRAREMGAPAEEETPDAAPEAASGETASETVAETVTPTGVPASQGVGMVRSSGQGAARIGGTGRGGSVSRETKSAASEDITSKMLEPASKLVEDAARLLPDLRVGRDYRARMETALDGLERQIAALRNSLKRGGK